MQTFRARSSDSDHQISGSYRSYDNFVRYAIARKGRPGEFYHVEIIDSITRPVYLGMCECVAK